MPPYDEALDATLTADGDQTVLVIEVRGMPLDAIAFYGVGWHQLATLRGEHVIGDAR